MASISNDLSVSLGNSIPLSAWTSVSSATQVDVSTSQAILIIKPTDDSFWAFFWTPNSAAAPRVTVPGNSAYTLFTKPSGFTGQSLAAAFYSPVYPEPVLLINGEENYGSSILQNYILSYYKFDIRPYFNL